MEMKWAESEPGNKERVPSSAKMRRIYSYSKSEDEIEKKWKWISWKFEKKQLLMEGQYSPGAHSFYINLCNPGECHKMHSVKNTTDSKWRRNSCVVLSRCSFYSTGPTFCPHRLISCVQLAQTPPPVTLFLTLWSTLFQRLPLQIFPFKSKFFSMDILYKYFSWYKKTKMN